MAAMDKIPVELGKRRVRIKVALSDQNNVTQLNEIPTELRTSFKGAHQESNIISDSSEDEPKIATNDVAAVPLQIADFSVDDKEIKEETKKPVPAPRRAKTPNTCEQATDLHGVNESEGDLKAVLSTPLPMATLDMVPMSDNEDVKKPADRGDQEDVSTTPKRSAKARRKKRKAAQLIANALRRESKKIPHVSTILQESGENEKDYGDIYSPWDSPPPPTSLEKVYIQHKYGFSVRDWSDFYSKPTNIQSPQRNRSFADVALAFHVVWSRISVFSHGVVAGVACCHALAVTAALASTQGSVPDFVKFYNFLSLKIHFAVYILISLCIISCFDRLDACEVKREHLRLMGRCHGTLLVTVGYILCLSLSLAAHRHTAAIEVYASYPFLWDSQGLHEWICLVTVRDVLLLLCWVLMSCSTPRDLLHEKLVAMTVPLTTQTTQINGM